MEFVIKNCRHVKICARWEERRRAVSPRGGTSLLNPPGQTGMCEETQEDLRQRPLQSIALQVRGGLRLRTALRVDQGLRQRTLRLIAGL